MAERFTKHAVRQCFYSTGSDVQLQMWFDGYCAVL